MSIIFGTCKPPRAIVTREELFHFAQVTERYAPDGMSVHHFPGQLGYGNSDWGFANRRGPFDLPARRCYWITTWPAMIEGVQQQDHGERFGLLAQVGMMKI